MTCQWLEYGHEWAWRFSSFHWVHIYSKLLKQFVGFCNNRRRKYPLRLNLTLFFWWFCRLIVKISSEHPCSSEPWNPVLDTPLVLKQHVFPFKFWIVGRALFQAGYSVRTLLWSSEDSLLQIKSCLKVMKFGWISSDLTGKTTFLSNFSQIFRHKVTRFTHSWASWVTIRIDLQSILQGRLFSSFIVFKHIIPGSLEGWLSHTTSTILSYSSLAILT